MEEDKTIGTSLEGQRKIGRNANLLTSVNQGWLLKTFVSGVDNTFSKSTLGDEILTSHHVKGRAL